MVDCVYSDCIMTTGCGCCSYNIDFSRKDEVVEHIKENVSVAIDACEAIGINFDELVDSVKKENKKFAY